MRTIKTQKINEVSAAPAQVLLTIGNVAAILTILTTFKDTDDLKDTMNEDISVCPNMRLLSQTLESLINSYERMGDATVIIAPPPAQEDKVDPSAEHRPQSTTD
jgi:hypothetical protein